MKCETIGNATLYLADYRDVEFPNNIDAVFTDPPYGITNCLWDVQTDMKTFWSKVLSSIKENAPIVIFGAGLFYVDVVNSNREMFRYELVYEKSNAVGFLNANRCPLRAHELMAVFYNKLPEYHPQKFKGKPYIQNGYKDDVTKIYKSQRIVHRTSNIDGLRYPRSVLYMDDPDMHRKVTYDRHPTAKPVSLMEWLVNSYTSENQIVLDTFMGSGTTGIAAIKNKRHFIGVEKEQKWFDTACFRIEHEVQKIEHDTNNDIMYYM